MITKQNICQKTELEEGATSAIARNGNSSYVAPDIVGETYCYSSVSYSFLLLLLLLFLFQAKVCPRKFSAMHDQKLIEAWHKVQSLSEVVHGNFFKIKIAAVSMETNEMY